MNTRFSAYNKIAIIGAGGLGKEVLCILGELMGWENLSRKVDFVVEDQFLSQQSVMGIPVLPISTTKSLFDGMIIAIGDLEARIRISKLFPEGSKFITCLHPSVQMTPYTRLNEGAIVLGNVLLSCDVEIGKFAIINPGVTISHDTVIGDFFTASPGVHISGGCTIGDRVFMGTGAVIRNGVTIGNDVTIGMGAVVVGDIMHYGTYIGNPAKLI